MEGLGQRDSLSLLTSIPPKMQIRLKGNPHTLDGEPTVTGLLHTLQLAGKPVVVELDGRALTPADHSSSELAEGSRVEIIVLAAGG